MSENFAEKIHDPTEYRRQQARARGHVARSREFESAGVLILGLAALLWLGRDATECLARLGATMWGGTAWLTADTEFVAEFWSGLAPQLARALLPILCLIALGAGFLQLLETGWLFRPAHVLPDWSRIDPWQGLARLWSLDRLLVGTLAVFKIVLIGAVIGACLYGQRDAIMRLAGLDAAQIAPILCELLLWTALKAGGCLLAVGLADYAYRWWRHEQSLKLSAAELREEQRDLQANPEIASRRRALQRDAASRWARGSEKREDLDGRTIQPATSARVATAAPSSRP